MTFGRNIPGGGKVSMDEVFEFCQGYVSVYYEGFTLTNHIGFYKGEEELSFSVQVVTDDLTSARRLASLYCTLYKQESVLVTVQNLEECNFVTAKG
jgi:hypothetical protein